MIWNILVTAYMKEANLLEKEVTVYYDNNHLKRVDSEKPLGVTIEQNMSIK